MALVRKKNPEWKPSEKPDLQVGEVMEIDDFRRLVEEGNADFVDEGGNVLPLPGTIFVCGICFEKVESHASYVQHIMSAHTTAEQKEKQEEVVEGETFGEKMAKARAAARAKRLANRK